MKMLNATGRYILRAVVVGLIAAVVYLKAQMPGISGDAWLEALFTWVLSSASYAGIGALSMNLEPKVGRKATSLP